MVTQVPGCYYRAQGIIRDPTSCGENSGMQRSDEVEGLPAGEEYLREAIRKLAHDFSNVLAPVQMSAYLLRTHVEGEEGEEILNAMEASVVQGMDLVRQAQAIARGGEDR